MNIDKKYPKPLLKWVGGKTQILSKLLEHFPKDINNYREIFLGGGSVLMALLWEVQEGNIHIENNIYVYDVNSYLISLYLHIQKDDNLFYEEIVKYMNIYKSLSFENKESYYYSCRNRWNEMNETEKKSIHGAALFLFLNKTCFRGLYRMGPKGFNVPFGHYENPEIINQQHLKEIHDLIQPVYFIVADFHESMNIEKMEKGDFVYCDPPYAPETDTSFVKYTEEGFSKEMHQELFLLFHTLRDFDIRGFMNNADVKMVREEFPENKGYHIESILCKRTIHSKKPETKTTEIFIRNF